MFYSLRILILLLVILFLNLVMPWETDLVNSFYGLLGLGAACALKFFYPSVKKFLIRKLGRESAHRVDPKMRDDILQSLREVLSIGDHPPQQ
jgi:hypothetical protein